MSQLPDLNHLSHAEKDVLIQALWAQVQGLLARVAALEAKLGEPSKTPDNSSLPPSKGQKPNQPEKAEPIGPRKGSLGRKGGGRSLACDPDEAVTAKPAACAHCQSTLTDADQVLHGRYDKIDLPMVRPMVTRVERYAGHCRCCGGVTLAAIPAGLEDGSPFSTNILAVAIYLRFTHAISYRRLTRLFLHLYALQISEGALDAMLQRAKPCFDTEVAAILARLRRSRIVCSDETSVRIDGRTHWDWVFQNDQVVIHVVRNSRAASVITETMAGHRPSIWVSDLYGAQQGHADLWQVCLAHQLRDCQYAIEAGDTIFAPRMKALLLRAVVLARRRKSLAESTRRAWQRRLDHELNAIMVLAPTNSHGRRLRKRYGKVRSHLFTFLEHPEVPPDNNGSERELRPTATYRKVTGGFRSQWGAELFAGVRSVIWYCGTTGNGCVSRYSCSARRRICHSAGLSRYLLWVWFVLQWPASRITRALATTAYSLPAHAVAPRCGTNASSGRCTEPAYARQSRLPAQSVAGAANVTTGRTSDGQWLYHPGRRNRPHRYTGCRLHTLRPGRQVFNGDADPATRTALCIPELLRVLSTDCPKRKSVSVYDLCGVHYPRLAALFITEWPSGQSPR